MSVAEWPNFCGAQAQNEMRISIHVSYAGKIRNLYNGQPFAEMEVKMTNTGRAEMEVKMINTGRAEKEHRIDKR